MPRQTGAFHAKHRLSSKPVSSDRSRSRTASTVSSKSATCPRRYLVEGSVCQIARCQSGGGVCAMAMLAWPGLRER